MFGMQKMCEQNLCKEEINKYKRAFAIFDAEGEGTITTEKLSNVMKSLGGCPPWAVLHDMIDAADSDRNGEIDFPEFLMLMTGYEDTNISEDSIDSGSRSARLLKEREEELCDMFMMFDKDKSGTISVDELSKVMVTFGGLDKDELDIMIKEADKDNDGQLEFAEFVTMMSRPGDEPMEKDANEIWNVMLKKLESIQERRRSST